MSKLTAAFLTHYPDLIRYLRRRTHCSELAQDCAHDTWLRLLEKGKQVTADNHRAYVFRVAANIAADWYRRQTREQAAFDGYALSVAHHHAPDTYEEVLAKETLQRLEQALMVQSQRSVRIFMMHRCEEMSYAQIAQKLSVSESTVEKHMMRILLVAHQVFNSAA